MPSPMLNVAQLTQTIQYTGSNSADIDAQIPGSSIVSETGGVLTVNLGGNNHVLSTGDWVFWNVNGYFTLSDTQYLAEWDCVSTCSELEDVSELASIPAVRAIGTAAVPTLLLGQDATVSVTLQPAMPDSGYSAYAVTFGGVNLADLDITSVSVVDTDTVDVAVDNGGAGTVSGVTVMVHAID